MIGPTAFLPLGLLVGGGKAKALGLAKVSPIKILRSNIYRNLEHFDQSRRLHVRCSGDPTFRLAHHQCGKNGRLSFVQAQNSETIHEIDYGFMQVFAKVHRTGRSEKVVVDSWLEKVERDGCWI